MSLFKIKRQKKQICGIDPLDDSEWTMLIKPQIQNVTLFAHLKKNWNVTEVEPDEENNIKEVRKHDSFNITIGFIKDGQFIVQANNIYRKGLFMKKLSIYEEDGYIKHDEMYLGGFPSEPVYHGSNGNQKSFHNSIDLSKIMSSGNLPSVGTSLGVYTNTNNP